MNRIKTKEGHILESSLWDSDKSETLLIADLRMQKTQKRISRATKVMRSLDKLPLWKVTTEKGYELEVSKLREFPVLRSLGRDISHRDIKGYVDVPLKDIPVGEAIMLYGKSKDDPISQGFNSRCPEINSLATMISMIQIRPDRFLRLDEQTGEVKLCLDTVREKGWFNINDLNSLRPFAVAASEFINQNNLPMMKNLHYFGYKSHLGEIIYDLTWLEKRLHGVCNISDLYMVSNFDSIHNCSHLTFRKILRVFMESCFFVKGQGKKTTFHIYHESDELLKNIQVRLLDYGIVTSRVNSKADVIYNHWDKSHLQSYKKHLKRKSLGKLNKLNISVLSIEPSCLDRFVDLTSYNSCKLSELRKLKSLRACSRAKKLYSRNVFWDRIQSIKKVGKGHEYRLIHPNGGHLIVNGFVVGE